MRSTTLTSAVITKSLRSLRHMSETPTRKVRTLTQIIKRINKIQIMTQTIAIIPAPDASETTTTAEGTLTMLRITTQRSHQMLKLLSKNL